MRGVSFQFRMDLCLKIAVLLEELLQHIRSVSNVQRRVGSARWIVGHLDQARVSKRVGARESVDSEINCWLQDEHHTNTVSLRPNLYFDLLGLAAGLQRGHGLIDFRLCERFVLFLR